MPCHVLQIASSGRVILITGRPIRTWGVVRQRQCLLSVPPARKDINTTKEIKGYRITNDHKNIESLNKQYKNNKRHEALALKCQNAKHRKLRTSIAAWYLDPPPHCRPLGAPFIASGLCLALLLSNPDVGMRLNRGQWLTVVRQKLPVRLSVAKKVCPLH